MAQRVIDDALAALPAAVVLGAVLLRLHEDGGAAPPLVRLEGMTLVPVLAILSSMIVHVGWPGLGHGQTPGMGLLGLRIVDDEGQLPGTGALMDRWLLSVVDGVVPLGVVFMLATPRHQRLGDLVAETVVIRLPT